MTEESQPNVTEEFQPNVLLMWDWHGGPLWPSVPVSKLLEADLASWLDDYFTLVGEPWLDDSPDDHSRDPGWESMNRRGWELARRLRSEVPQTYTVSYWDILLDQSIIVDRNDERRDSTNP